MSDVAFRLLEWENEENPLAALSSVQQKCIEELGEIASERAIPSHLPRNDGSLDLANSFSQNVKPDSEQRDGAVPQYIKDAIDGKLPPDIWQVYSVLSNMENEICRQEDEQYSNFAGAVKKNRDECCNILNEVFQTLQLLESLQKQYQLVSTKTNTLHDACEQLLAEQAKLVETADNISDKLSYFTELDQISQKLNSPTLSVLNESFGPMLTRIDECIAFLTTYPQFKESSVYLVKFRHCLSRALGLVSSYVMRSLQNATQQVLPQKEAPTLQDNAFTLFYGKFRTNAPRIKALMEQIESRAANSSEYQQLLSDCCQCYINQRELLLVPSVASTVTDFANNHKRDHCTLVRSGCAFLLRVCEDEQRLFLQFFSQTSPQLNTFLESLCGKLYDVLRPLIIHINHLETLSELCSILKLEMLEEHVHNSDIRISAFESAMIQMLQDVQERLVYRSHVYIRTDILNYNPAPGDLAYPEKLEMMASIAESLMQVSLRRTESRSSVDSSTSQEVALGDEESSLSSRRSMSNSPADLHGMWYPTVRRTLVCLSKLYRCIDRTIFQGLSQEALATCIQSLISAGETISKKQTPLDGQLFQIKHLLILREQIAPFQVDFTIRETSLDFSKVKDAAVNLLQRKAKMFSMTSNNSILEFITTGTLQVTENFVDSKKDVDNQLKAVCDKFIKQSTELLVSPMFAFLDKANVILKITNEEPQRAVKLSNQAFATTEAVSLVVIETVRQIKTKLPSLQRAMSLYLSNKETEAILFRPVKKNIQRSLEQLVHVIRSNYSEEDWTIIACPTVEQMNVLLAK